MLLLNLWGAIPLVILKGCTHSTWLLTHNINGVLATPYIKVGATVAYRDCIVIEVSSLVQ